jgi:hypothetical protein
MCLLKMATDAFTEYDGDNWYAKRREKGQLD